MTNENSVKKIVSVRVNTYAQSLSKAVEMLRERRDCEKFDVNKKYILFVPDKYTLLAEKLLYSDGGSFNSEVLTINRLCYKLAEHDCIECARPISRLGAVLTVRRILSENASKLKCFSKSAQYPGFGETVYDNICQLASCGLRSCDLPDNDGSVTAYKLSDLKFVYEKYEQAVNGKYVDAAGRLFMLADNLPASDYFNGASVFFACYDSFTPIARSIVKTICDKSDYAAIVKADCRLSAPLSIEDYSARNSADELKAAAARICELSVAGVSYDDMCVISPGADYNRLKRIFTEYDIPFFTDAKYALSSHPLARYVYDLFAAAQSATNDNFVKLAKNPYSGIKKSDADMFENYIRLLGLADGCVKYKFAIKPLNGDLAGKLDTVEAVRARLISLTKDIKGTYDGKRFSEAVIGAIPKNEPEITAGYVTAIQNPLKEIIAAAESFADVFTGETPFSVLCDALREAFTLKEVGVIPSGSNRVEVGDVSAFRASEKKYTFVLGFHEGELPLVRRDEGLLSDNDLITASSLSQKPIEPSIRELNARAEAELRSVLSQTEHLFLSHVEGENVSPLMRELQAQAQSVGSDIKVSGHEIEMTQLVKAGEVLYPRKKQNPAPEADNVAAAAQSLIDACAEQSDLSVDGDDIDMTEDEAMLTAVAMLTKLCPTLSAAQELYYVGDGELKVGGYGHGFEPELKAALGKVYVNSEFNGEVSNAGEVYGSKISISKVQEYFACPLRCYFKYGLKIAPRPTGKVSALNVGSFLHRVVELFVKDYGYSDPEKNVPVIIKRVFDESPDILSGASDGFIQRITSEAVSVTSIVADQMRKGNFVPEFTEVVFGENGELCGDEIKLEHGSVKLEGIIDRVDVCGNAARVIDYKTGKAEFDLADLYFGKKIQLPIYLHVLSLNGYTPAGMFYFPFSSKFGMDDNYYRLDGPYSAEYAVDMDVKLNDAEYVSDVIKAKTLSAKSMNEYKTGKKKAKNAAAEYGLYNYNVCVDRQTLECMSEYALKVLTQGALEMLGGYCAPSPLKKKKECECDYCEMKEVCRTLNGVISYRNKRSVDTQLILDSISADDGLSGENNGK